MKKPAFVLATMLILLGVCLFASAALVTVSILEAKISLSQRQGVAAYYAAESGVQDALWRLKNNATYNAALQAGTLNVSYFANNVPTTGSSFTVTMKQVAGQPNGNGTIDVTGSIVAGAITAKRRIVTNVFQGATGATVGTNTMLAGGPISFSNGAVQVNVVGGNIFSDSTIDLNSAKLDLHNNSFYSVGAYTQNPDPSSDVVNVAGKYALNYGNAPVTKIIPSFDFASAKAAAQASGTYYTPAQFDALVPNGNSSATIPLNGPVTYIDGSLSMTNHYKNKTFNVTGALVIMGNLDVPTSIGGMSVNITTVPGSPSGLFVSGNANSSAGTWTIAGVYYAGGDITMSNSQSFNMTGALIGGGAVTINNGNAWNITYNSTVINDTFPGSGTASPLQVRHWEEQY